VRIEIFESARDDLALACAFYARQGPGLGTYFLDSLSSDIEALLLFAGIHSVHFDHYHRMLFKRFPFAVYYRVAGEIVREYAVLDCRQDPQRIEDRFKREEE
jgi:hypothetical protein